MQKRVGLTTKIPFTYRIIINISLHQLVPSISPLMLLNVLKIDVVTPEFKDLLNLEWNKQNW